MATSPHKSRPAAAAQFTRRRIEDERAELNLHAVLRAPSSMKVGNFKHFLGLLRAASWVRLASFWTAPGFATELMHLYLATGLAPATGDRRGPAEDERLELEWLPFPDAVAAAERGEFADAKSLLGLLLVDRVRRGREDTAGREP